MRTPRRSRRRQDRYRHRQRGTIWLAGMTTPLRQSCTTVRLPAPVTRNTSCRVAARRAGLREMRCGGGLGASVTASTGARSGYRPVAPGEQAGGMAIFTQAEQHEIEFRDAGKFLRIRCRTRIRPAFGRDAVNVAARDGHMIEPGHLRHPAVALDVIRRQAALVAETRSASVTNRQQRHAAVHGHAVAWCRRPAPDERCRVGR